MSDIDWFIIVVAAAPIATIGVLTTRELLRMRSKDR